MADNLNIFELINGQGKDMGKHLKKLFIGMGSVLDISPTPRNHEMQFPTLKSDADAIESDWIAIGQDIEGAMRAHSQKSQQHKIPKDDYITS